MPLKLKYILLVGLLVCMAFKTPAQELPAAAQDAVKVNLFNKTLFEEELKHRARQQTAKYSMLSLQAHNDC